jgi:predicted ester cyclase
VKLENLAPAILALAMLWQSFAVAQDVAPPSSTAAPQSASPQTATGSPEQIKGTNPASQSASSLSESPPAESQPVDAMPRKYIEMWNSGDLHPVTNMFTRPAFITFHGQRRLLDTGTVAKVITSWRKSMPDLSFRIEDTIVQGDRVVMRLTFSGSYKERLFADTAAPEVTPRIVHAVEMLIFQIRDGKISEIWEDYDELVMRLQMGAVWRSNEQLAACPCKPDADSTTQAPSPQSRP